MSWNGFYVGGNLGGAIEHASGTSDFLDPTGGLFGDPASNPQDNTFSSSAFVGGVQIGYNWQFDPRWFAGVEGDWDFTNTGYDLCRQTSRSVGGCANTGDGFEIISSNTRWLATARVRLGITAGNFLLYGTGGAAWGSVVTNLTQN